MSCLLGGPVRFCLVGRFVGQTFVVGHGKLYTVATSASAHPSLGPHVLLIGRGSFETALSHCAVSVYAYLLRIGPHHGQGTYPMVPDCAAKDVGSESGNQIQEARGALRFVG